MQYLPGGSGVHVFLHGRGLLRWSIKDTRRKLSSGLNKVRDQIFEKTTRKQCVRQKGEGCYYFDVIVLTKQ